ncbi:MAG: 23S rRNA (pseudouridine(1915)-N(3))-methyltransferase RlmH [Bacteroidales bacterium]|nr:23S rRNA (pseudouridine(1915)-N(3))-methyltransferase RlmH [Bacteroidales bacterium]
MKIKLIFVGKTTDEAVDLGMQKYIKRLRRYTNLDIEVIPALKNTKKMNESEIKNKEGELILGKISNSDFLVLLDEKGKEYTSVSFSEFIDRKIMQGVKNLVFVVGGAYGFSELVYQKAQQKISLSQMTFSHQIIRLIFMEQLYRSFTIMKNEPYHHV